jgi:hypothetical protein
MAERHYKLARKEKGHDGENRSDVSKCLSYPLRFEESTPKTKEAVATRLKYL